jgi:hypothetical protein
MGALIAILMALAAPASEPVAVPSEGPALEMPAARAEDTVGFKTFERYCLDATRWKGTPDLARAEGEMSPLESRAFAPGGDFRVFLASAEPRVLLGLQWREQRLGPSLVGVEGRCTIFAYEDVWEGMAETLERITGIEPRNISSAETGMDGLMVTDMAAFEQVEDVNRPNTFGATRLDGTTMYRAIL